MRCHAMRCDAMLVSCPCQLHRCSSTQLSAHSSVVCTDRVAAAGGQRLTQQMQALTAEGRFDEVRTRTAVAQRQPPAGNARGNEMTASADAHSVN